MQDQLNDTCLLMLDNSLRSHSARRDKTRRIDRANRSDCGGTHTRMRTPVVWAST